MTPGFETVAGKSVEHVLPTWVAGESVLGHFMTSDGDLFNSETLAPIRPQELGDRSPEAYNPLIEPTPAEQARSVGEEIAARGLREQKDEVDAFLTDCGLAAEVVELEAVENRLQGRTERDRRHAAFSARTLLEAIADDLFPARGEPWIDLGGIEREVGQENVANRLSAYVDRHLTGKIEGAERRAFQADLDATARWVGAGPHGVHTAVAAERAYTRLMAVLATMARAYRVAEGQ